MHPPCAILERKVMFVSTGAPPAGGPSTGSASKEAAAAVGSQDQEIPIETILQAMRPVPAVHHPPELSRISMVRQMGGGGVHGGFISSTNKELVVLYAGDYRPGCSNTPSSGCYLVYDASSNSLQAVPQLPYSYSFRARGLGAAIVSHGSGNYVLAELLTSKTSGFPNGALYLWHWPSPNQGQWTLNSVGFPPQVLAPTFRIDMAFSYGDSCVCWVDLLTGVLICNLVKSPEPEFTLVPLPPGCSVDVSDRRRPRPRPQEFRTMGCVNGAIKFVAIVGFNENIDSKDLTMRSWTLSPDLEEWKAGNPLAVSDLWESESFRERNLPKVAPTFPVISTTESQVIYVMMNDVDRVPTRNFFGNVDFVDIVLKARYMLSLDPTRNKVLHSTKVFTDNMTSLTPEVVASEFSAYIYGSKGCQEGLEASKAGASRKQIKH
nr:unnamed protein product [Digitaria exilis]